MDRVGEWIHCRRYISKSGNQKLKKVEAEEFSIKQSEIKQLQLYENEVEQKRIQSIKTAGDGGNVVENWNEHE